MVVVVVVVGGGGGGGGGDYKQNALIFCCGFSKERFDTIDCLKYLGYIPDHRTAIDCIAMNHTGRNHHYRCTLVRGKTSQLHVLQRSFQALCAM